MAVHPCSNTMVRSVRTGTEVSHHDGAAVGEFDEASRREQRREDLEFVVAAVGGGTILELSTSSTLP